MRRQLRREHEEQSQNLNSVPHRPSNYIMHIYKYIYVHIPIHVHNSS